MVFLSNRSNNNSKTNNNNDNNNSETRGDLQNYVSAVWRESRLRPLLRGWDPDPDDDRDPVCRDVRRTESGRELRGLIRGNSAR